MSSSRPQSETAVFQHVPDPDASLKREWEPGCQPDQLYDAYLPAWRAWLRRILVRRLRRENAWMARWQKEVRSEARDKFFYWTAIFGTHTFFMMFLPILFFFGRSFEARRLLHVVGLGIYISSFTKDLVCTPRPYSPPVIRLSMSTHHHEYGFPSSHSTNSVSIALFFGQWLFHARDFLGWSIVLSGWLGLCIYAASVVGGRLYTGMHSTADVIGGSFMGIICWLFWMALGSQNERWIMSGSWTVPSILIPLGLTCIHYHPEPMDDCPCFEDAIAVLAVLLGGAMGHWASIAVWPALQLQDATRITSYSGAIACLVVIFRLLFGLGVLFAWRLAAKATLLRILPPLFRGISDVTHTKLPTRRFYKAATDYNHVPPHLTFRTIPSVLDLQRADRSDSSPSPTASPLLVPQARPSREGISQSQSGPRMRSTDYQKRSTSASDVAVQRPINRRRAAFKYDAEVLTKVGVYSGIGFLATTLVPHWFEVIESLLIG